MSNVDLFDRFTTKPVTCTWIIEKFFESTQHRKKISSPESKLYVGAFNLELVLGSDNAYVSFVARGTIPEFYYLISVIDKKGEKWNPQEGRAEKQFTYDIWFRYLRNTNYGLLSDFGDLTIYCEIFEFHYIANRHNSLVSLSQDHQALLDSGELSDVVLAVGDREFKAHKLILSARSVVFKKMFEHDLEESRRNRVEIEDMSAGAAEDLLKFIYTGKVGHLDQHAYELFAAADKYQIDSLKSCCELYLALSLSPSTIPATLQLADLYSLEDLKSKCIHYIGHHSAEFGFDAWKEFTASRPELMYQLFVRSRPK